MDKLQVKQARKLLGLTQEEFARSLGWGRSQVGNLESGRSTCTKQTALAIECLLRRKKLG